MRFLAIETSCDETAVAIVEATGGVKEPIFHVAGNALYSQAKKHAQYGGVFPSLAKREHGTNLVPLLTRALTDAHLLMKEKKTYPEELFEELDSILSREQVLSAGLIEFLRNHAKVPLDAIAVTRGPGLEPALWVGVNFARALSLFWGVPVVPINHLEGHIISAVVNQVGDGATYTFGEVRFPLLALLISGGHTELVHTPEWGTYRVVGRTRDDAVGEAFDKVARLLGLPYPGGPELSRLANLTRANAHRVVPGVEKYEVRFPRPMLTSQNLDFSFSGLKTAVLYEVQKRGELSPHMKGVIAREFEDSVTEVLVGKTRRALELYPARTLIAGGGVAANTHIRRSLARMFTELQPQDAFHVPDAALTGDNAVMIGMAAYMRQMLGIVHEVTEEKPLSANGSMRLG